jgi:hypothetical protein
MALLGLVLVWSLYLPTIVGLAHMRLSNQRLTLRVLAWIPSSAPLTIVAREGLMHLSPTEITQLKNVGITGTVSYAMNPATYGSGKASRVLLLMQEPVEHALSYENPMRLRSFMCNTAKSGRCTRRMPAPFQEQFEFSLSGKIINRAK